MLWCLRLKGQEEKKEGGVCSEGREVELRVGEEAIGGQLKSHPKRGDLKARVRFREFGLSARRVHAHTDTRTGTHV